MHANEDLRIINSAGDLELQLIIHNEFVLFEPL